MKIRFDDPLFEAWTQRFLYTMSEGGCEIVEIKAPAGRTEQWQDQILAHVLRRDLEPVASWRACPGSGVRPRSECASLARPFVGMTMRRRDFIAAQDRSSSMLHRKRCRR
jgi:hypothetical protein